MKLKHLIVFILLGYNMISTAQNTMPYWAPGKGYRLKIRHIYFPEYNFYYDTQKASYIYQEGNHWLNSDSIPQKLVNEDLINASKVQLRIETDTPQSENLIHQKKYANKRNPRENWEMKEMKASKKNKANP